MSVVVTYKAVATVVETLGANTGSAPANTRVVTHTDYNEEFTLNSGSTPPATQCAHFLLTLSGGAATINLASLTGTNGGPVDMTGLRVQIFRVKNLGANPMTFSEGASNGYAGVTLTIPPGGHVQLYSPDALGDVASGDRTIDAAGTGSQTAEVTIIAG